MGWNYPASIATLAQRWPNVNPYVGPTSANQRWANVDLSIGPTLAQRLHANVVPTSAQRWHTNVGPTLAQRYANGCMPTLYQHWPNGGCVTGFLWGEPIGHRSVTGWTNSRVEKPVIWDTNVIDVNVIFTCLKMWLFCFEDVQTDPNTMYKRIMACCWPVPSH